MSSALWPKLIKVELPNNFPISSRDLWIGREEAFKALMFSGDCLAAVILDKFIMLLYMVLGLQKKKRPYLMASANFLEAFNNLLKDSSVGAVLRAMIEASISPAVESPKILAAGPCALGLVKAIVWNWFTAAIKALLLPDNSKNNINNQCP